MSYSFGLGPRHLSAVIASIAEREGVELVNYTDPGCRCGHGCESGECPACRRHWFSAPDQGEPFNSQTKQRVMAAVQELVCRSCMADHLDSPDACAACEYKSPPGEED